MSGSRLSNAGVRPCKKTSSPKAPATMGWRAPEDRMSSTRVSMPGNLDLSASKPPFSQNRQWEAESVAAKLSGTLSAIGPGETAKKVLGLSLNSAAQWAQKETAASP